MGKKVLLNTLWKPNFANAYLISYDIALIKFRSLLHTTGISAHTTGHWPNYTHGSRVAGTAAAVFIFVHLFLILMDRNCRLRKFPKNASLHITWKPMEGLGSHCCLQKHILYGHILPWI